MISSKANSKLTENSNSSKLNKFFLLEVPYETFLNWTNEFKKNKKIDRFREGHAPNSFFRKDWEKACIDEFLSEIRAEYKDEKIFSALYLIKEDNEEIISFDIRIEFEPKFDSISISEVKLNNFTCKVSKEEAKKAIQDWGKNNQVEGEISKKPSAMGDFLKISSFVEEVGTSTRTEETLNIRLGAGQFLPEIEEKLLNKNVDDVVIHEFKPENYDKTLKAVIKIVEIKNPKERSFEEVMNFFGKKTEDELTSFFQEQLELESKTYSKNLLIEQAKVQVANMIDFETPISIVEKKSNVILQQLLKDSRYSQDMDFEKFVEEKFKMKKREFEEKIETVAKKTAQLSLMLIKIAKEAEIKITQTEIDEAILAQKHYFYNNENKTKEFFKKNEDAYEDLYVNLIEKKALQEVAAKATIEEKEIAIKDLYEISLYNNSQLKF